MNGGALVGCDSLKESKCCDEATKKKINAAKNATKICSEFGEIKLEPKR